jgi:hypothetical protein
MPKKPAYLTLPHLKPDELLDRDHEEFRLGKQLSTCWSGDDFDVERSYQIMRASAELIFDVLYVAYRKKPDYKAGWLPEIVKDAVYRTLKISQDHIRYGISIPYLSELGDVLEATVLAHIKDLKRTDQQQTEVAAAPAWPPVGQQARAYAASGIDIASSSPLLIMAATAARGAPALVERTQTVNPSERMALRDAYRRAFPDVKIADIIWAAKQTRREWTRWITGQAKDGLKPDRSFKHVLTSGKSPEQIIGKPRPTKYTT